MSTLSEFQNIAVTLIDPAAVEQDYDIDTGETVTISDGEFWSGPARLIAVRWGVNRENSETANPDTQTSIQVQFPRNPNFGLPEAPLYRLVRGITLRVDEASENPALTSMVFTCTSDIQGGNAASRTIEFALSGDALAHQGVS